MKGTKVIFAVCLALLGIGDAWANESDDAVRAATRRGTTNTITSSRQKTTTPSTSLNTASASRISNATKQAQSTRERTTVPRTNATPSTTSRTTARNTTPRTNANVSARTTNTTRPATTSRASVRTPTIQNRATSTRNALNRTSITRSATSQDIRDTILNSNARECRQVYYNCMDEFCANKDSQLKRCACSSRLHEFDNVKKQLETAEDKMLDFSQRLLTVSMDAKDAAAINIATEGELAFNQKDTSESKKVLDEIAKKLNTNFDDDSFDRNLTAISLSLNEDAAFDNIDSLMGASTTLKTGTALYGAALPVCREMAAEVCTPEQLSIAESGYQMMIEQDCNTVKKSYQSQTDAARTKVLENSALLDMSRLSTYQDKNSDDILTCKRKMLDMLSDTSVCGTDLTKCLDMTGQYIDPSTGEAFLTVDLANLGNLITRPTSDRTWTDMPGNETFAKYLDSKKIFLEPAMAHCQDISDSVWNQFIEDALAQIKLAQDAKLEQIRQSCTTLTTQCLANTANSLSDFDARALSTFGVIADKTVNEMCADVKNACTALMDTTDTPDSTWTTGITEIATDITYDTIVNTCNEVGRACIIQACKSVSGNFGLCENIETSVNRNAIIGRTACWNEVLECVRDAGDDNIDRIMKRLAERKIVSESADTTVPVYSFYDDLYNIGTDITVHTGEENNGCITSGTEGNEYKRCVYDICSAERKCNNNNDKSPKCMACRIAERIWGHCEAEPSAFNELTEYNADAHNMIIAPIDSTKTTLLHWFAQNTGTAKLSDSCRDTTCSAGEKMDNGTCYPLKDFTSDGIKCDPYTTITVTETITNCCESNAWDSFDNCCDSGKTFTIDNKTICTPSDTNKFVTTFTPNGSNGEHILVCLGTLSSSTGDNTPDGFPSGDTIQCSGKFMAVSDSGIYYNPATDDTDQFVTNYYKTSASDECTYNGNAWSCDTPPTNWKVKFNTSEN